MDKERGKSGETGNPQPAGAQHSLDRREDFLYNESAAREARSVLTWMLDETNFCGECARALPAFSGVCISED